MHNKLFSKSVLFSLLFITVGVSAQAEDTPVVFTVDGISYKQFTDVGFQDCVYVTPSVNGKYEGAIVIPDFVTFDNYSYKVLGIGDNSFKDCTELTSVQMDAIVVFIGNYAFENCTGLQNLTVRLNKFWNAPSPMSNGLHVGYRAFYGCRLKNFTLDAHDTPPYYTQNNPSNNYANVTSDQFNNWFDRNDRWETYTYPYMNSVWTFTTFYVPAGHGVDYKYYDNNYPYNLWGYYFGKIQEFGTDPYDNVFGMKCDTIPNLTHITDSLMSVGRDRSMFAYDYLMQYIDSIAKSESKEPDYSQLEAAFDKVELNNEGGTYTIPMIPKINSILKSVYNNISQADNLCDDMRLQRMQYYEAKNAYEIRLKYNDNQGQKADVENKKVALKTKIEEMNMWVHRAENELAYLVDLGDSLFVKEMWDFINAFKQGTTGISLKTIDVRDMHYRWYSIDGYRIDEPRRGINIIGGKKIFVK